MDATGSERIANGFVDRIKARCQRIGEAPRGGRQRADLMPGLHTVPFERSAVICYVLENDRVLVTNIFYGGQDYEAQFKGPSPTV